MNKFTYKKALEIEKEVDELGIKKAEVIKSYVDNSIIITYFFSDVDRFKETCKSMESNGWVCYCKPYSRTLYDEFFSLFTGRCITVDCISFYKQMKNEYLYQD